MLSEVIIVGCGGHGKVVADIIKSAGDKVIGFLDDFSKQKSFLGCPILGTSAQYKKYSQISFVIAVGNSHTREFIAKQMPDAHWYTAVHPRAVISPEVISLGEGTVVMANAVINACSTIGKHCIINTGAVVEHDNQIGNYVHVSVGAKLAGTVRIGSHSWIGIGASISNNITVCEECMIGAGAVVIKDITESGIYVGVPAHKIATNE